MAKEIELDKIGPVARNEFELVERKDFRASLRERKALLDKLFVEHRAIVNDPTRQLDVGFVASFPVGDGKALYRVEKLRPLTLQHIPFGDKWRIPAAHLRGLQLTDLQQQLRSERFWLKK